MTRQIIALGGGGFSDRPRAFNPLDAYVLAQTAKDRPRVCFLATASGDSDHYLARFYSTFALHDCRPSHLPLFARTPPVRETLLGQDVIYVGGGNTRSMLAVWRAWDLPQILEEAWAAGIVLAGVSAGAICWFEEGITDSSAEGLRPQQGLGLLAGSCCPHYSTEAARRPALRALLTAGAIGDGLALDDGVAAHFRERRLHRIVAENLSGRAFEVRRAGASVAERGLEIEALETADEPPG